MVDLEKDTAAAEIPAAETPLKVKKKLPVGVKIILCCLICAVLFIICVLAVVSTAVKVSISEEKINLFVKNIDYEEICISDNNNIRVSLQEILGGNTSVEQPEKCSLSKLLRNTDILDEVSGRLYNYTEFIFYGKALDEIDKRSVEKFYDNNLKKIEKSMSIVFSDKDKQNFYSALEENKKMFDYLSEDNIENNLGTALSALRFLESSIGIAVILGAGVVLIALFILVTRNAGTVFITVGSLVSLTGALGIAASVLTLNGKVGVDIESLSLVSIIYQSAVSVFAYDIVNVMTYTAAIGLATIILGIFINVIFKKIHSKKMIYKGE